MQQLSKYKTISIQDWSVLLHDACDGRGWHLTQHCKLIQNEIEQYRLQYSMAHSVGLDQIASQPIDYGKGE